jgi:hypothetical protein
MGDLDSLDTVELAFLLEEAMKKKTFDELDKALFSRVSCPAERWQLESSDPANSLPGDALVIGRNGSKVLFILNDLYKFGVGHEAPERVIREANVYPTFQRALFDFR